MQRSLKSYFVCSSLLCVHRALMSWTQGLSYAVHNCITFRFGPSLWLQDHLRVVHVVTIQLQYALAYVPTLGIIWLGI